MKKTPTVQWRIMVRLLPMLALIFSGILYWLGEDLKGMLYASNLEIARRANMAVVQVVASSMVVSGKDHTQWDRVAEKIARDDGTEIQIISTHGEVLFATDPSQRGIIHRFADPVCAVCHEDGSVRASRQSAFIHNAEDALFQVFAAPLGNTEDCRPCHAEGGAKLGMVFVQRSLEPVHRQVWAVQVGIALAGAIALILVLVTVRVLMGRYLNRPLKTLIAGAEEIGTGNLQYAIELPDRTELSVLADTLNASTARLAKLQGELVEQARLAAIGETAAGLAHCLKNMINGLRAGQFVIDRGLAKNDIEKLKTGWEVMRDSIGRVEKLTADLLYCVRTRVPERAPTNPNDVIREVIELLHDLAAEKGVALRAVLDEEIGEGALDRTLIYRALLNLATNAIDACVESESGDLVTLESRGTPDDIVLSVEDNGVGMSDEVQSQLFTRFFSTKSGRGTGLGLPVVKKITEEHGGALRMRSEPGRGSVFSMHLPRAARESQV